ncbi:SPOR domain-containing protein [Marinicella litoralis]|uniref:Sporulation related protein n=1 Tax=Marinicella litoralis TaxID=644220 RepID=A0A4R6XLC2_9GAMM|nr:SPOR domain-containing protein [Marinicella litoralis]TDR20405.1 sporulation related protein [Marinicella litoralis]
MTNDQLIKFKLLTTTLLLMFVAGSDAQSDPSDTPENANETNIICYAAKSKWVCAPADEKERAQEKAMKLALGESEQNRFTNENSQAVEIQTIESNNIGQQVETYEDPLQSSIKDFIPREDAIAPSKSAELNEPAAQSAVPDSSEQPTNAQDTSTVTTTIVPSVTPSADFSQWQSQFADYWTFQVIGTSNRHHLAEFIAQHGLAQTDHSIVKTQVNGADWWVVLSGIYLSRDQALSQRDTLPTALSTNAWVRQIKSIVGQAD